MVIGLGGAALWFVGLHRVDVASLGAGGLFPAIPIVAFIGLALVLVTMIGALGRSRSWSTAAAVFHVGLLVIVLAAASLAVERVLGYRVSYRHAGVVDEIVTTGRINGALDAYFSWPGFFTLAGFIGGVSGVGNVQSVAPWAPLFYDLLYMLPLVILYRQYASSRRHVAVGCALFMMGNWVFQDYFSPQATAYFAYLVIVMLLLRFYDAGRGAPSRLVRLPITFVSRLIPRRPSRTANRGFVGRSAASRAELAALGPEQRMGLFIIVVVATGALASSHQLTPLMLVLGALALVLVGRCSNLSLVLSIAAVVAIWDVFVGAPFLSGNLSSLIRDVGNLGLVADQNVSGRLAGDPAHVLVVRIRMGFSGLLALGALVGLIRRRRQGHSDLPFAAMAVSALFLLPVVSYGGEILVRVYYFALPFLAFFAAAPLAELLEPRGRRRILRVLAATSCLAVALTLFVITRFGNENTDSFTVDERAAIAATYAAAPPGATLLSLSGNLPWKYTSYHAYRYLAVDNDKAVRSGAIDAPAAAERVLGSAIKSGAYLVLARADRAYAQQFGTLPKGTADAIRTKVLQDFETTVVFDSPDATVIRIDALRSGGNG